MHPLRYLVAQLSFPSQENLETVLPLWLKFFPPFYKSIIVLVTYVRQHRKRLQDAESPRPIPSYYISYFRKVSITLMYLQVFSSLTIFMLASHLKRLKTGEMFKWFWWVFFWAGLGTPDTGWWSSTDAWLPLFLNDVTGIRRPACIRNILVPFPFSRRRRCVIHLYFVFLHLMKWRRCSYSGKSEIAYHHFTRRFMTDVFHQMKLCVCLADMAE